MDMANRSHEPYSIEIEIPSRVNMVSVVRMIVSAATNSVGALHGERLDDLRWVTSEATTNAIQANQSTNPSATVKVTCEINDGLVRLIVQDKGPGLPSLMNVPAITNPERLDIEGSFGIPLIEHLSSSVSFRSEPTGTTVEMELEQ